MASHSFGHQRSWGTFSYTVFWCILFDWATLSVPVYWVDTSFSCQEHSFSDKAPKQTSFDAKSHEAWIWGFTMDLSCFTRVHEICHVGNIWKRRHSGTLHWELRADQLDSKIEGGSTPISVCWYLNIFNNVLYDFHDRCLVCATCTGCLHLGTRVVSAMIRPNTRDRFRFPRISH